MTDKFFKMSKEERKSRGSLTFVRDPDTGNIIARVLESKLGPVTITPERSWELSSFVLSPREGEDLLS